MFRSHPPACPESLGERIANAVTHGIGAGLSLAGLVLLIGLASRHGTALEIASVAVYGTSLVLLYLASTAYHAVRGPRARRLCRQIDHVAIFLLIAGTYTPVALISLGGVWGWSLFAVIWALAATGVLLKLGGRACRERTWLIFYLAMGWLFVVTVGELAPAVGAGGLAWLVVGGLAYTGGVAFYLWDRLPFHHAVWHLFVLAGSACHFAAIAFHVLPRAA